jgi:hypothetical protein
MWNAKVEEETCKMKQRCYEDVTGKYRCGDVPIWLCGELECDPLKGAKVLKANPQQTTN